MNFTQLRAFAKTQLRTQLTKRFGVGVQPAAPLSSQAYWTGYNVTDHRRFASAEESLAYFDWRSAQYYDYLAYMPVSNLDGLTILDYGCGPGHDLVGFAVNSPGAQLIGMDVSRTSLAEASERLALHGAKATFCPIDETEKRLPLDTASIDYIHCSGVLHHVPDPIGVLQELRRVLRPEGRMRLMIYNYDSVWLHLYAAYIYGQKHPDAAGLSLKDAFRRITDSPDCPISHAWTPTDVATMAEAAGLQATHIGNAISMRELDILPQRFEAILDPRLGAEHRRFLLGLTFDSRGVPFYNGHAAGLDGCYELTAQSSLVSG
jgi:SAM-dependent methyltransferase